MKQSSGPKRDIQSEQAAELETLLVKEITPALLKGNQSPEVEEAVCTVMDRIREMVSAAMKPEDKEQTGLLRLYDLIRDIDELAAPLKEMNPFQREMSPNLATFMAKYKVALTALNPMLRKCGMEKLYLVVTDPEKDVSHPLHHGYYTAHEIRKMRESGDFKKMEVRDTLIFSHQLQENNVYNPLLLFLACRLLKYSGYISKKSEYRDTGIMTAELEDMFLRFIAICSEYKISRHEGQFNPLTGKVFPHQEPYLLDLNTEMILMELFNADNSFSGSDEILTNIREALMRQKAAEVKENDEYYPFGNPDKDFDNLEENGKYREIIRMRERHSGAVISHKTGQSIITAKLKLAARIDYDEIGLPFTNDPSPQYPWADLNAYRQQFIAAGVSPSDSYLYGMLGADGYRDNTGKRYADVELACVIAQMQIMKRASVAELLRKLVNADLNWGESKDLKSTRVGYYMGKIVKPRIVKPENGLYPVKPDMQVFGARLDGDFEATALPAEILFEPLNRMLNSEMDAFGARLEGLYGDKVRSRRVKKPESVLLKALKESRVSVGNVTDLIGFTILTDSDAETERIYHEVEGMIDPDKDIKGHDMWVKESSRGRRSMDITGVPKGNQVRIQVQCRPALNELVWEGRLANHEAYKVISGKKLRDIIKVSPDTYLDLLYRIIHNLNYAYHVSTHEKTAEPQRIMELYCRDYAKGLSIIRTGSLY